MKKMARVISTLFHPLLIPSLGLLILLNSGTYLSLLDPAAKRAIMFVIALGTLIFPLMLLPVLQYRTLVMNEQQAAGESKLLPKVIILALYVMTYVYFRKLPVNHVIHAYVFSVVLTLLILLALNAKYKVCMHSAAMGGLAGLVIALIFLYETPIQGLLMLVLLAGGLTASARLALEANRPWEVAAGYLIGFGVVLTTVLAF